MVQDPDGIVFFIDGEHPEQGRPTNSVFGSTAFDRLDQLFTVDGLDEVGSSSLPDDISAIPAVMADAPEVVAELHADIDTVLAEHASAPRIATRSTFEQVAAMAEAVVPVRMFDPKTDFILNGPRIEVKASRRFGRKSTATSSEGVR
ncbi:MAG: hypothetical protein RL205_146 [Actinomycetota bacterium]|jgi:hypothetical protein